MTELSVIFIIAEYIYLARWKLSWQYIFHESTELSTNALKQFRNSGQDKQTSVLLCGQHESITDGVSNEHNIIYSNYYSFMLLMLTLQCIHVINWRGTLDNGLSIINQATVVSNSNWAYGEVDFIENRRVSQILQSYILFINVN